MVALNEDEVRAAILSLVDAGIEALAVCFLWSFLAPEHEARVKAIAAEIAPQLYVTCSHELAPKWGEYERTTAVALNAYIGPLTVNYVTNLDRDVFALLLGGLATGRPTLQLVMGDAVPGLTDLGWRLLTRNWALLFIALLAANETARRLLSYDDWLSFKVWGVTLVIFAFTMAQTPLLVKHGMKLD